MSAAINAIRSGRVVRVGASRAAGASRIRQREPLDRRFGFLNVQRADDGRPPRTDGRTHPRSDAVSWLRCARCCPQSAQPNNRVSISGERKPTSSMAIVYSRRGSIVLPYSVAGRVDQQTRWKRGSRTAYGHTSSGPPSKSITFAPLHSTDSKPDTGVLVNDDGRWNQLLLDHRAPARSLSWYISQRFFVHDILDRESWHRRELRSAHACLRAWGISASADVHSFLALRGPIPAKHNSSATLPIDDVAWRRSSRTRGCFRRNRSRDFGKRATR